MNQLFQQNDDLWHRLAEGHINLLDDGSIQVITDIPSSMDILSSDTIHRLSQFPLLHMHYFEKSI